MGFGGVRYGFQSRRSFGLHGLDLGGCRARAEFSAQHGECGRNRGRYRLGNGWANLLAKRACGQTIRLKLLTMVVATKLTVDKTAGRRERSVTVTAPHQGLTRFHI